MEAAHSFRLQQKNILNTEAKKNQTKVKKVEKPTKAVAWVAKTFPPWQTIILETMKHLYTVSIIFYYKMNKIAYVLVCYKIIYLFCYI